MKIFEDFIDSVCEFVEELTTPRYDNDYQYCNHEVNSKLANLKTRSV